jgi:ankyrin repeat protein
MDLLDLMNDGMSYKAPDKNELMFMAASRGNVDSFQKHLAAGADIMHYTNGFNCMHIAVKKNRIEIVRLILSNHPASRNSLTTDGRSCEMLACFEGLLEMLVLLQDTTINQDVPPLSILTTDKSGNTALHYAGWGGHGTCVEHLVKSCGMDIHSTNSEGMDVLHFASAGNHVECMKHILLLMHACSPRVAVESVGLVTRTSSGMGPVHRAAMHGAVEVVKLLLQHFRETCPDTASAFTSGVGLFEKADNGNTPLHIAAHRGMRMMVLALLQEGGEHLQHEEWELFINMANNYGLTAVHFACIG